MKYLSGMKFVGAVCIMTGLAVVPGRLSFAQESPRGPSVAEERIINCDRFKENYARSSARKLVRALRSHNYELQEVKLDSEINVATARWRDESAQKLRFSVFMEPGRQIAGVMATSGHWPQTYTVAHTHLGPVVISHTWPLHAALRSGKAACQPVASAIEFPHVTASAVDVEPFRFWGMRVIWRLPSSKFKEHEANSTVQAALESVMRRQGSGDARDLEGLEVEAPKEEEDSPPDFDQDSGPVTDDDDGADDQRPSQATSMAEEHIPGP